MGPDRVRGDLVPFLAARSGRDEGEMDQGTINLTLTLTLILNLTLTLTLTLGVWLQS